jgi:cysteine desulfurase
MTVRSSGEPLYLDAFATTPIAPEALEALNAQLRHTGNPHSPHLAGAQAMNVVERARRAVADLIGSDPQEIVFTSGATEANNLAVIGWARAAARGGSTRRTIATSSVEHPSVLEAAAATTLEGFRHVIVPVTGDGVVDRSALADLLNEDTLLLAVMAANNVTGVVQPVEDVVRLARAAGALVHVDGAQAAGKISVDVAAWDVDSLSLSSHKVYGPPGAGALYVSATAPLKPAPIVHGGGQESGLRSGTVPAALLAGFGAAIDVARAQMGRDAEHLRHLEATFLETLSDRQVRYRINGSLEHRLPGAMNIALAGVVADDLVQKLSRTISLSTGSACSSGQIEVAPALSAMGIDAVAARSSLRIYFNRYLTVDDARVAAFEIAAAARPVALATGDVLQ